MKINSIHIKKLLFGAILAGMFLPLIQMKFKLIDVQPLDGYVFSEKKKYINLKNVLDGSYQRSADSLITQEIGFRPWMVKGRNQIYWLLNHQARTQSVLVGKNNYLFDLNYVNAWIGKDYKGEMDLSKLAGRFRLVQDSLKAKGVTLVIVLAPGKASFFPEYLPDSLQRKTSSPNNHDVLSLQLNKFGVNTLDFYNWFLAMKKNSAYPLYSKGGVHWSNYGADLAMDSLIHYLEKKTEKDMVGFKISSVAFADSVAKPDNDVSLSMNLLYPPKETRMAYTTKVWENPEGKYRPAIYAVSDSYFWQWFDNGLARKTASHVLFNFYNREVYDSRKENYWVAEPLEQRKFDPSEHKVLLFVCTEANLKDFPWNFLETAENAVGIKK